MSNIRSVDMLLIEDLFQMGDGYVLDFSNRTFTEFFRSELSIDIDAQRFQLSGTSKANRLRCFLRTVDQPTVVRALQALWDYREAVRMRNRREETTPDAGKRFADLLHRLGGSRPTSTQEPRPETATAVSPTVLTQLSNELIRLSSLAPQPRGYAFEAFLKSLFDAHGLEGREPFRLRGEQIDGSFVLSNETYLLEAKWQGAAIGAADLLAFNGKLENKAAWTRGLFISQSGFTEDGLHAFGRGKRVFCMDGLDLYDTLSRGIPLLDVLNGKVRRMAETGMPFVRVRDLFPG